MVIQINITQMRIIAFVCTLTGMILSAISVGSCSFLKREYVTSDVDDVRIGRNYVGLYRYIYAPRYCRSVSDRYDFNVIGDTSWVIARIFGIASTIFGTITMFLLFYQLWYGSNRNSSSNVHGNKRNKNRKQEQQRSSSSSSSSSLSIFSKHMIWSITIYLHFFCCLLQSMTFFMFNSNYCKNDKGRSISYNPTKCFIDQGAATSIAAIVLYFTSGYILYISKQPPTEPIMKSLGIIIVTPTASSKNKKKKKKVQQQPRHKVIDDDYDDKYDQEYQQKELLLPRRMEDDEEEDSSSSVELGNVNDNDYDYDDDDEPPAIRPKSARRPSGGLTSSISQIRTIPYDEQQEQQTTSIPSYEVPADDDDDEEEESPLPYHHTRFGGGGGEGGYSSASNTSRASLADNQSSTTEHEPPETIYSTSTNKTQFVGDINIGNINNNNNNKSMDSTTADDSKEGQFFDSSSIIDKNKSMDSADSFEC